MSVQITTAFVQQYKDNIMHLAQQDGSKLRNTVRVESVTGKQVFFDQIGATAARRRPSRHADTPRMDTPHARRRCSLEDFDWADLIDQEDKVRLLIDPTSDYSKAASKAMGRAIDEVIIDAIRGTSFTGETGSTSVPFSAGQQIAAAATGLTIAKLRTTKELLDVQDIDTEGRYFAASARQFTNLLATTEITSADYNTVKALVQGQVDTFMGFNFIRVDGLRIDGTGILPLNGSSNRLCYAWQRDQVALGIGAEPMARISERADKNYATQVFYSMSIGATRMQEVGVVEIECVP